MAEEVWTLSIESSAQIDASSSRPECAGRSDTTYRSSQLIEPPLVAHLQSALFSCTGRQCASASTRCSEKNINSY
jgi:hypothetical protein